MEKRQHLFFYGALSLLLAVSLLFCAWQSRQINQTTRELEDIYQSALQEGIDHLSGLNVKLQKLLIAQDMTLLLSQISRQAGEAQSCLALLPLSHQAMGEAIRFCARTGDYAQALLTQPELTTEDQQQLENLAAQAALLWGQLELSRQQMAESSARFLLADSAFYENAAGDIRPVEQLYSPDVVYPTLIYDGAFSDAKTLAAPRGLPPGEISQAQAIDAALAFVGDAALSAKAAPSAGGAIPAWGVTVETADVTLNLEITKQGGQVLWMMPEHGNFQPRASLADCQSQALAFLKTHGFDEMEMNHYQLYEGVATLNFAAVQQGVLLYPDQIKIQCRLDTGAVVGLEASNYWAHHTQRANLTPQLNKKEALERVSEKLAVTGTRLCLIPLREDEALCWEIAGTFEGDDYLVYIDGNTGAQREILKLLNTGEGTLTL